MGISFAILPHCLKPWCLEPPAHNLCTPEPGRPGCVISIQKGVNCDAYPFAVSQRVTKNLPVCFYSPMSGFKQLLVTVIKAELIFYSMWQQRAITCRFCALSVPSASPSSSRPGTPPATGRTRTARTSLSANFWWVLAFLNLFGFYVHRLINGGHIVLF